MEDCMNTQVLGMEESPGQWAFPKVAKNKSGGHHLVKKGLTGGKCEEDTVGIGASSALHIFASA